MRATSRQPTRDLARLQAAGGSQAEASALRGMGGGLSAYSGYVGESTAEYAMGYPLTGGSFLQDASEQAHLVLLPAANTVFTQENDALNAASGQAAELPTVSARWCSRCSPPSRCTGRSGGLPGAPTACSAPAW